MFYILIIIIGGVLGAVLQNISNSRELKKSEEKYKKRRQADLKRREERLSKLSEKYGVLTKEVAWGELSNALIPREHVFEDGSIGYSGGYVWCFEEGAVIVVSKFNNNPIKFKSILQCDLSINNSISQSTTYTSTSNSNTIGRAIVGGVLAGGVGAIIGGTTGNSTSSTHTTNESTYKVCLQLDDINSPNLIINLANNENKARELYALIGIIIKRIESDYYDIK